MAESELRLSFEALPNVATRFVGSADADESTTRNSNCDASIRRLVRASLGIRAFRA
jgi:hypothetical protein